MTRNASRSKLNFCLFNRKMNIYLISVVRQIEPVVIIKNSLDKLPQIRL